MAFNVAFYNVLMLGFGFMFVFTAFQTMGNIETTMLNSIKNESHGEFSGDGYTSLAIIYAVFATANWLAPSVVAMIGERISMVVGAVFYTLFIASFLWPQTWLLYLASVVVGIGAAMIWTAQGSALTRNSNEDTMSRNSGLFWAMLQCSLFLGNLFVYFEFQEQDTIPKATRNLTTGVLLAVAALGIVFLVILRPPPEGIDKNIPISGPLEALRSSGRLFVTKDMLLLSVTFIYTGVELSFFSGVYGTSVGNTQAFNKPKQLVGLSGIFIGIGEVLGGACFGLLGKRTTKYGRDPIVLVGFLLHIVAFYCIFCNLPDNAPMQNTHDHAYFNSNVYLAITCSFLLGLADSCYNTQIYSLLGSVYSQDSAPAFALFKFTQSLGAAICFFYSLHVSLYAQMGILVVLAIPATVCFCLVEWRTSVKRTDTNDTACAEPIKQA